MNRKHGIMLVFVACVGMLVAIDCVAAIYKYEDKDGMINFSDDLQSIPAQYRTGAKIVSGEPEEDTKPPASNKQSPLAEKNSDVSAPVESPAPSQPLTGSARPFSRRALISVIIVVSVLFIFSLLNVLGSEYAKSVKMARIFLLWGVSVYVIWAHFGDVLHLITSAGKKVEAVQQQAADKGKKAAKAVKALDSMLEQVENSAIREKISQDDNNNKEEQTRN